MSNVRSEYQDEYRALSCRAPEKPLVAEHLILCQASEGKQPVGGRVHHEVQQQLQQHSRLPTCDEGFMVQVYASEDRGTHRVEHCWKDPRWSDPMPCSECVMYEPTQYHPPNRANFYCYKSTIVDPLQTPCQPLAVPDVHKLRYMHNNYMSQDDWY